MNLLRRLPLSRLLLLCGLVAALGVSLTALASAVGSGPTPPPKPLAEAVHGALTAPSVQGFTANVKLTNHLLEGVDLASGSGSGSGAGQLASSPLLSGASGRLWVAKDGRVRLELQQEKGDTQIYYDGHTVSVYDASTNTVYRYTPPASSATQKNSGGAADTKAADTHEPPSVAKIEEGISKLKQQHVNLSGATPGDVAGQPTYTVRVSPSEGGSLIGGAELSWDANSGLPLRAAVYSSTSSSPVIELAATDEVSYGPVADSVFEFKPPAGAKVQDVKLPEKSATPTKGSADSGKHPTVTQHGHGITSVGVVEEQTAGQKSSSTLPEGLPRVKINGATATELPTALGTILSFERSGVRYVLGGFVAPSTIEAVARGL